MMADFGLVMPFVVCASQGGPFDDDAFVAGYECGRIDAALETAKRPLTNIFYPTTEFTVRVSSIPQLDLIAMRHGFTMSATTTEESGWWVVSFQRSSAHDAD